MEKKNVHPDARLHLDEDRGRAELWDTIDGAETFIGFIGFAEETIGGQVVTRLQHTIIAPAHGRKGYARCLVTLMLDDLEARGRSFISECSYIDEFLHRHPEYRRLQAPVS